MPVSYFSPSVIHVFIKQQKYVITIGRSSQSQQKIQDEHVVIGAATCSIDSLPFVFLIYSTGYILELKLGRTKHIKIPSNPFTFIDSHPKSKIISRLDCDSIGRLVSISQIYYHHSSNNEKCQCYVILHGTLGTARFNSHTKSLNHIRIWPSFTNSVLYGLVFRQTPIQKYEKNKGILTTVCVTYSGFVLMCLGTHLLEYQDEMSVKENNSEIVTNIQDAPIFIMASKENDIIVIVGDNGGVTILYPDSESSNGIGVHKVNVCTGNYVSEHGIMNFTTSMVNVYQIGMHELMISIKSPCMKHDFEVNIKYDIEIGNIIIDNIIDEDEDKSDEIEYDNDDINDKMAELQMNKTFKTLLKNIDNQSNIYKIACYERDELHELIKSYNAAMHFATEAIKQNNKKDNGCVISHEEILKPMLTEHRNGMFCEFSPSPYRMYVEGPVLEYFNPPIGRSIYINTRLYNGTNVTISKGWNLHLRLFFRHPFSNNNNQPNNEQLLNDLKGDQIVYEMCTALDILESDKSMCVSFEFPLNSHAPLYISAELHFRYACEESFPKSKSFTIGMNDNNDNNKNQYNNNNNDLVLHICDDIRIDILNSSTQLTEENLRRRLNGHRDMSWKYVASNARTTSNIHESNLLSTFSIPRVKPKEHPIIHRFQVPINKNILCKILNISNTNSTKATTYVSILEALFEIHVHTVPSLPDHVSNISVNATRHIGPFVRTAIIHRVLENKDCIIDMRVVGANRINQWQRSLLDKIEDFAHIKQNTETLLVCAKRVFTVMERRMNENDDKYIHDGNGDEGTYDVFEWEALSRAVVSMTSLYEKWRELMEDIWSPNGAKYISSSAS